MVRSVTVEQPGTLQLPVPGDADTSAAGSGWGRTWQVSPDLMGVADERGVFAISNPAWGRTLGWSAAEIAGRPCFDFIHPDDVARTQDVFEAAMKSGEPAIRFENRYRRKDGGWRWLSWVAVPEGGKVYCSARDVTAQKRLDEQLLARTLERDRAWNIAQDLLTVLDLAGAFTAVNRAWSASLGWSEAELLGNNFAGFTHADDLAGTQRVFRGIAERPLTTPWEFRLRHRDGGYRWFAWTAAMENGAIYASGRETTQNHEREQALRQAEAALRQAQKLEAVGQLTGGVAHDFNNILTVIRSSIDVLRLPQLPEPRRLRFMESIADAVTRATRLTSQLLAFARRQALQPAVFDAASNLEAIGDMVDSLTGAGITVETLAPDADCFVNVDPSQFDTAIVNLAVNARDAMAGHGRLTMRVALVDGIPAGRSHAARTGEFIAVSVSDTGSGISPDHLSQIFEPFFTTKGVGEGTGLGLSQVFGFAKQSGGEIDVASTVGAGSTFTLYLPRAGRPASNEAQATPAARLAEGGGARILVVEDNTDVAHSVLQTLEQLGYSTVHALSADHALAELDKDGDGFALVFSDVVMAGRSGVELGHEIRRRHPSLPVILSSGYSHVLAADPTHGFQLLPKPYAIEELARVLHEAITRTALPGNAADLRPANLEAMRQAELDSMGVLDTDAEAAYDELTRLAASLFGAPIALVSLVDSDRQWFKSRVGLQASETPREHAFCAHAIQDPERVMVVSDATRDPRFAANPLVTGAPNIRFYAGAPLLSSSGHALGTLCVIDREVREADQNKLETLRFLAAEVIQRMEARRAARQAGTAE
jgi:PAS domain S-box-containing protein